VKKWIIDESAVWVYRQNESGDQEVTG
jgi:hypothetical protein